MSEELFVGNLPPATTSEDLEQAFARWGGRDGVVAAAAPAPPEAYGFVSVDAALVPDAVEAMNGSRLQGHRVTVYPALWRHAPAELGDEPYPRGRAEENS